VHRSCGRAALGKRAYLIARALIPVHSLQRMELLSFRSVPPPPPHPSSAASSRPRPIPLRFIYACACQPAHSHFHETHRRKQRPVTDTLASPPPSPLPPFFPFSPCLRPITAALSLASSVLGFARACVNVLGKFRGRGGGGGGGGCRELKMSRYHGVKLDANSLELAVEIFQDLA